MTKESAAALSLEYRSLGPQDREYYANLGRHATEAHALGVSSFPMFSRRLRRARGDGTETLPGQAAASQYTSEEAKAFQERVCSGESLSFPMAACGRDADKKSFKLAFASAARQQASLCRTSPKEAEARAKKVSADLRAYDETHSANLLDHKPGLRSLPCASWHALPVSPGNWGLECAFHPEGVLSEAPRMERELGPYRGLGERSTDC